jgi:hypothetical protein
MAGNTTDYSALEDFVVSTLQTALTYAPDANVINYNGDMDLTPEAFAEYGAAGRPVVVVAIENVGLEQLTQEGGKHPRVFWATAEVAIYLYDESLRGDKHEAMEGLSGVTRSPGIWKLMEDVQTALTGEDPVTGSTSLKWEGPVWTSSAKIASGKGRQLWRLACDYEGAVEWQVDTSGLDDLGFIAGDFNVEPETAFDPDVESLLDLG